MSIELKGNWEKGLAFDVHTLSSTYLGVDAAGHHQFDNVRSEMGQLVYNLKYSSDISGLESIITLLDKIKGIESMDVLVPTPSSKQDRLIQPVLAITRRLGEHHGVPVLEGVLTKTHSGKELKNVLDTDERLQILRETMYLEPEGIVEGQNVLLIDDLYRSGATLTVATELLYQKGRAKSVKVLTMTKTRSNR